MAELGTKSSFAVQPELVFAKGRPSQHRVAGYGLPISGEGSTRIQHDQFPISTTQLSPSALRICTGIPVIDSISVVGSRQPYHEGEQSNLIEWSWLPDAQWQVAVHRHGQGLSTSRGLYADEDGWLHLYLNLPDDWPVYGLGEKTGELNKQGRKWTFWNSDVFEPHTEANDCLYQSIPFMMIATDQGWMGVFLDNLGRSVIDLSLAGEVCISVESGAIDLYVLYGEKITDVIDQYTRLTGRPFLPPRWSLGYQQSRHSYQSVDEVMNLVEGFSENDLPLDAVYLDIMYMDEYRVFTFDSTKFANAPEMIDDLLEQGIRTVPIVDPGVKCDPDFRIYQQGIRADYFVQAVTGEVWKGAVWPGESAWPDFYQPSVRHWWRDLHRYYTDMGVQGIWNDMNEPAVFNDRMTIDADAQHKADGEWVDHAAVHNGYGLLMSEATAEAIAEQCGQRPFVLTRAGYAGIQRSAAVWTGDNRSSWEHLRMSIPMLLNLGLSGVVFSGADIGGFMDDARPELFARWMQLGCFYPLMRNHCSIEQARQEPWAFGDEITDIVRQAMHRRYKLLPYLSQLFRDAHETGLPIMRPMFWLEEHKPQTENLSDQFMFGDDILVAPMLSPGKTSRAVWLPKGRWYSVLERKGLVGESHVLALADLSETPIYLKAGAILPLAPYQASTSLVQKELRLLVVEGGQDGRLLYREDDGETLSRQNNTYARLSFGYHDKGDVIECHLSLALTLYKPSWQRLVLGVPVSWQGKQIRINGEVINGQTRVDGVRCRIEIIEPADWL